VIDLVVDGEVDRDELVALYDAVGWSAYTHDPDGLAASVAASSRIVLARDGSGRLVGLARCLSDLRTVAYLQDVLVDPALQRGRLGTRLVRACLDALPVRQQVLLTDVDPTQLAFYASFGFTSTSEHDPPLTAFVRFPG
jgi:predicted GNAT family N-acyltransferase